MTQDYIKDLLLKAEAAKIYETDGVDFRAAANPETILALLTLNDRLVEALRVVMQHASPEEGQMWAFRFNTGERLYDEWTETLQSVEQFKKTGEVG